MRKHLPNLLTVLRIVLCVPLLFTAPFSPEFFFLYTACGVSDMLDGYLARKWGCASQTGAALDSLADTVFVAAALFRLIPAMLLPLWLLFWIAGIALVKLLGLAVGFARQRKLAFLHTYANKAVGLLLFCFPYGFFLFGIRAGAVLCLLSSLAAIEELVLHIVSPDLNQDVKGIFFEFRRKMK